MATLKVKTEKGLEYIYDPRLSEENYQSAIKVNGLLKGNGNEVIEAIENEDYQPPLKVNGIVKGQNNNYTAASANTDYLEPISDSGLLKNNGLGNALSIAKEGTDYEGPMVMETITDGSVLNLKGNYFYTVVPTSSAFTINYSLMGTIPTVKRISGGLLKPTQDTTFTFLNFSKIKGADDLTADNTLLVKANEIWEFSNLQGYLLLKNWSEE